LNRDQKTWRVWGALLGASALALVLSGCSGGDTGTETTAPTGGTGAVATGPTGPGGRQLPMPGGFGGGQSLGAPGAAAAPGAAGTQVAAAPPKDTTPPPHRDDPFKPWWSTEASLPPVLSIIQPQRIAMYGSGKPEEQPNIEIQEVPNRRVAGILSGDGAYALVEGPEGQSVVKPGDMLGEYRVAAIDADSVTLRRKVGTQTFTQKVPLTDVGSTTVAQFSPPAGGPGGPGLPGGGLRPGGGDRGGKALEGEE